MADLPDTAAVGATRDRTRSRCGGQSRVGHACLVGTCAVDLQLGGLHQAPMTACSALTHYPPAASTAPFERPACWHECRIYIRRMVDGRRMNYGDCRRRIHEKLTRSVRHNHFAASAEKVVAAGGQRPEDEACCARTRSVTPARPSPPPSPTDSAVAVGPGWSGDKREKEGTQRGTCPGVHGTLSILESQQAGTPKPMSARARGRFSQDEFVTPSRPERLLPWCGRATSTIGFQDDPRGDGPVRGHLPVLADIVVAHPASARFVTSGCPAPAGPPTPTRVEAASAQIDPPLWPTRQI